MLQSLAKAEDASKIWRAEIVRMGEMTDDSVERAKVLKSWISFDLGKITLQHGQVYTIENVTVHCPFSFVRCSGTKIQN